MAITSTRPLASAHEVGDYLQVPAHTLAQWRHRGIGPRYHRVGKHVRYRWADVDAWVDEQARGGVADE
jgi:excisionase family DNA binding protein